jgi:hypothetical protein
MPEHETPPHDPPGRSSLQTPSPSWSSSLSRRERGGVRASKAPRACLKLTPSTLDVAPRSGFMLGGVLTKGALGVTPIFNGSSGSARELPLKMGVTNTRFFSCTPPSMKPLRGATAMAERVGLRYAWSCLRSPHPGKTLSQRERESTRKALRGLRIAGGNK